MKKDQNIKLNRLSARELNQREKSGIKGGIGGDCCGCGCCYEGEPGGATTGENAYANSVGGLYSTECTPYACGTKLDQGQSSPLPTCGPGGNS